MNAFFILLGLAIVIEALNQGSAIENIVKAYKKSTPEDDRMVLVDELLEKLDGLYVDLHNEETQEVPSKEVVTNINQQINFTQTMVAKLLDKAN